MDNEGRPMSTADLAQAGEAQPPATDSRESAEPQPQSSTAEAAPTALLPSEEATELRRKWDNIQAGFVDEPRRAVEDADALVASAMKRLAEIFAAERSSLESQWDRGDNVSTEDLRLALQRYRAFFARLLTV